MQRVCGFAPLRFHCQPGQRNPKSQSVANANPERIAFLLWPKARSTQRFAMLRREVTRVIRSSFSGQVRFATTEGWQKPHTLDLPSMSADGRRRTVTVLPGDGVGPEVIASAQEAIAATGEGPFSLFLQLTTH